MSWIQTFLGKLPGGDDSQANAISDDGTVIVGEGNTAPGASNVPIRFSRTGPPTALPLPAGFDKGSALCCSPDGSLIGGYAQSIDYNTYHACYWTSGGTVLHDIGIVGDTDGSHEYGQVLQIASDNNNMLLNGGHNYAYTSPTVGIAQDLFLWTIEGGLFLPLLLPPGVTHPLYYADGCMSSDASFIAATAMNSPTSRNWAYTTGNVAVLLPDPTGAAPTSTFLRVTGMTRDGNVVLGGNAQTNVWGKWTGGVFAAIAAPPGFASITGLLMNADGSVVAAQGGTFFAPLWAVRVGGAWTNLPLIGYDPATGLSTSVIAVKADGVEMVGIDNSTAVIWGPDVPPPPPPPPPPTQVTVADLWFGNTASFVDLSLADTRRKFTALNGGAVYLGQGGAVPFGTQPPVFLSRVAQPGDFAANRGSGGAFAISGGTLEDGGPAPPCTVIATTHTTATPVATKSVVGDYRNGNLYALSAEAFADAGTPRRWLRRWRALPKSVEQAVRFGTLHIDMETGAVSDADGVLPVVALRWSDDGGHSWSEPRVASAGMRGQTRHVVRFTRLGSKRRHTSSDRVFELSSDDPMKLAIFDAELEVS